MKATRLTKRTAEEIIHSMQKYAAAHEGRVCSCSAACYLAEPKAKWATYGIVCYAPIAGYYDPPTTGVNAPWHPDHFGIAFQGGGQLKTVPYFGREAYEYLTYLLDPKGIFSGVLPFLYHSTPKEVWEDRGFVFKSLANRRCNPGLVWTFMQATRRLFEHPNETKRLRFLRSICKDRKIVLMSFLGLQPTGAFGTHKWVPIIGSHGECLSRYVQELAPRILTGKHLMVRSHKPGRSYLCFGDVSNVIGDINHKFDEKPINDWITEFRGHYDAANAA